MNGWNVPFDKPRNQLFLTSAFEEPRGGVYAGPGENGVVLTQARPARNIQAPVIKLRLCSGS